MVQRGIAYAGILASVVFAIIRPDMLAVGMVVVQGGVYYLAHRLAAPPKLRSWGIVYDEQTKRPLANAVARIFEPKYNKLLETKITDSKGRYAFLLGPSKYYAVFEKQGFRPTQLKGIDYQGNQAATPFTEDVGMKSVDGSTSQMPLINSSTPSTSSGSINEKKISPEPVEGQQLDRDPDDKTQFQL